MLPFYQTCASTVLFARLARIGSQQLVDARHHPGQLSRVSLSGPTEGRIHMDRRLHQMLQEDKDYEAGLLPPPVESDQLIMAVEDMEEAPCGPQISIDNWKKRGYYVVNVRSRDRPKLMFDTICALTHLNFDVVHAYVSSRASLAIQEYYVRQSDEMPETEMEVGKFIRCILAAMERREAHGQKVEICAPIRDRLMTDVNKLFKEKGLSLAGAEWVRQQTSDVGSFYVTGAEGGDLRRLEVVPDEIGGGEIYFETNDGSGGSGRRCRAAGSFGFSRSNAPPPDSGFCGALKEDKRRPKLSWGGLIWSRIRQFFGSIRSIFNIFN